MTGKLPMALPILQLAEAHVRLVGGCARASASATGSLGGRPVPWVLGHGGGPVIVAESWDLLAAHHRRKRGFTALCQRLNSLLELARSHMKSDAAIVQVWADGENNLDAVLLAKVALQIGSPIELFEQAGLPAAMAAVQKAITAQHVTDYNPLVAALGFVKSLSSAATEY